jgi:hypothetical protein
MNHHITPPLAPTLRPTADNPDTFRTESLELTSYLLARGYQLIGTDRADDSPMVIFVFPGEAAGDTASFFAGTVPLPPIKIFEAHRTLRMMVSTMKNPGAVRRGRGGVA